MNWRILLCFSAALPLFSAGILRGADLGFDSAKIEAITGLKGTTNTKEGVFKVTSPRKDVAITVDGWRMPPFMGLTSWAAFKAGGQRQAMVMGDLVLFEDEVNPVMSALLDHGLQVTALHNHFFFDQPHVFFMHIGGEGTIEELAGGVRAVFDTVKQTRAAHPELGRQFTALGLPEKSSITAEPLEAIMAAKAQRNSGMVKFVFGRETTMECGCPAGTEMGVNTWAAFAGADDNAVVDGDFAMKESELQQVLKILRGDGINIVAIHQHMTGETPRIIFLHYWGRGKAADLAGSLKKALATQAQ
ncbi:MAG TPA: DUF1259 domain-containing protein [Candidatus Didemnitutus sp.]|nr:DUF1259 domain-containing protein [Candidatus Didemnitutus sp.]